MKYPPRLRGEERVSLNSLRDLLKPSVTWPYISQGQE
jgi:hypothetical protein